ncbi:UDP-glycosyltransferase 13-like isoform X2 [Quercus lobata]|uniref:Uncharacterized protein n=1 Tax=Quercus lobata TaxID=97700 RepID=A0A7N2LB24_QUELO|nr:UDP-glycosyltransferase 13-like isoform X2 [Quercus lobata]
MSTCNELSQPHQPHVALLPSAGMGHLTPFLRLATKLFHHHCRVTLITTHPTVSLTESQFISRFLSAFPQVTQLQFHLLTLDPSMANSNDPFWLRFEAIRCSAHLLSPLLSSLSPPLHALIYDVIYDDYLDLTKEEKQLKQPREETCEELDKMVKKLKNQRNV